MTVEHFSSVGITSNLTWLILKWRGRSDLNESRLSWLKYVEVSSNWWFLQPVERWANEMNELDEVFVRAVGSSLNPFVFGLQFLMFVGDKKAVLHRVSTRAIPVIDHHRSMTIDGQLRPIDVLVSHRSSWLTPQRRQMLSRQKNLPFQGHLHFYILIMRIMVIIVHIRCVCLMVLFG